MWIETTAHRMYREDDINKREDLLKTLRDLRSQIGDQIITHSISSAPVKVPTSQYLQILKLFEALIKNFETYVKASRIRE